jgi:AcrR family transcriptional regulator
MKQRDLKTRIIDTSYQLFAQKGYNDVAVQDICTACGITKPTFYKYIGSKEQLLSYFFLSLKDFIPDEWYKIPDGTNYWRKILEGYCFFLDHCQRLGTDLYTETFVSNINSYKGTFNDVRPFTDIMVDLIQFAQESGQIKNMTNPKELYKIGVALSMGNGCYWCMNGGKNDFLANFAAELSACFMAEEPYGTE